jgi:fermentation-respiration switch protein FrsA (DUF1100 family)
MALPPRNEPPATTTPVTATTPTRSRIAFVAADPADHARKVKAPALMLQGATDQHVPPRSAERLVAMRAGGNRDATALLLPNVSHTLCSDIDGSALGWQWLPSWRLSNALLVTMTDWLVAKMR